MITVTIDDSKQAGKDIITLLRRYRRIVYFENESDASPDSNIPEGYVSEEVFWNEFDRKLLESYGKV